jgi:hypothetical protein
LLPMTSFNAMRRGPSLACDQGIRANLGEDRDHDAASRQHSRQYARLNPISARNRNR